ncbi:MAG: peptidyl-prolyl cis-trans isomerase, partial [Acidobacteria bacterium]|nr:peptidyl-prolyl cis-trans isomerase [Acidobacteriota bacterium]
IPEHQAGFERFIKSRLSDFADQTSNNQHEIDQRKSQLLDQFILRQLIVHEALKKNIEPTDDEIRRVLEEQYQQTIPSSNALNQTSGESNVKEPRSSILEGSERRIEIINELLSLKFYQKTGILKDVKVTPEEIEAYYQANLGRYQGKNGYYVREIRVSDQAVANKLHRQALAQPGEFAVLAKLHSEVPMASNGGWIYYEPQQLPQVLEKAITPLKVGSISKVIKSNYGFHIFKLEKRAEPIPLEQVKKEIEAKLLSEKNQTLINEFNKRALESAKITIYYDRLGFTYLRNITSS